MKQYKSAITLAILILTVYCSKADISTKNDYTGIWNAVGSWTGGTQPSPLTTGISNTENIDIFGYITRNGNLSFANIGNNSYQLNINDTLVVQGNLSFANNSINLTVGPSGLLVVFGNFIANNKVDLNNGGTMVVTGDMTLSGGQQDYSGTGGLYVDGVISGNGDTGDADGVDQPSSNLNGGSEGEQNLYDFIQDGGSTPLPITLGSFALSSSETHIALEWVTLTEENFERFEILRSSDGVNYVMIGAVAGHNFSTSEIQYHFIDSEPLFGVSYYQLRAVDIDGSEELFNPISIRYGSEQIDFNISSNSGEIQLDILAPREASFQEIQIYDLNGKLLLQKTGVVESIKFQSEIKNTILIAKLQFDGLTINKKFLIRE